MKNLKFFQVDSFTQEKFKGNPAGVIPYADGLSEEEMQAIARELNNSETAFILSPTSDDHEVWVRFFTPHIEVPSCGHATIAAHYVRALLGKMETCTVVQKIGAGILPVEIFQEKDDYRIVMTQGKIEFGEPLEENQSEILTALGLSRQDWDNKCPLQIVSTGHSKVLVGIHSRGKLNSLHPDMTKLSEISKKINCNGFFVFVLDLKSKNTLSHGRMFAPAIGINEDPVTGNANGPLGAYLVHHQLVPLNNDIFTFNGQQGEAMGRTGIVQVSVYHKNGEPQTVKVGGHAVVAIQGEIIL